jgi:hypothetical protein
METDGLHFAALAGWQSGYAAVCNTVYAGSIPTPASSIFSRLKRCQGIPREALMSLGLLPDGPSKKTGKDRLLHSPSQRVRKNQAGVWATPNHPKRLAASEVLSVSI